MSETSHHERRLAEEKAWLVQRGNAIGERAKGSREWKHQIGGLQAAAARETEPEVLLNLLRYQKARNGGAWRDSFQPLHDAMTQCGDKAAGDTALAMLLLRHLLLYTSRAYTYHAEKQKEEEEEQKRRRPQQGGGR